MIDTACIPGSAATEWTPVGQDLRDVAPYLRLLLRSGISFAIATVLDASGVIVRSPGTVLVISEAGDTIGFNPAGPVDRAIRDLAARTLMTGHDRPDRLEIEQDAASYIGLSGAVSLAVHATRVPAGDPAFDGALRYLVSGTAAVVILATHGASGRAVIGPDRVAGRFSHRELPPPVINDARAMLGGCHTVRKTYRLGSPQACPEIEVWMQAIRRKTPAHRQTTAA
jgi:xanthine dehydrogenase accessory factor